MNRLISFLAITLTPLATLAGSLGDYIEHPIAKTQLVSLGQQTVEFKPCSDCSAYSAKLSADVQFFEQGTSIDRKRALELSLSGQYEQLSVFYRRSTGIADRIQFGIVPEGNDELLDPEQETQQ